MLHGCDEIRAAVPPPILGSFWAAGPNLREKHALATPSRDLSNDQTTTSKPSNSNFQICQRRGEQAPRNPVRCKTRRASPRAHKLEYYDSLRYRRVCACVGQCLPPPWTTAFRSCTYCCCCTRKIALRAYAPTFQAGRSRNVSRKIFRAIRLDAFERCRRRCKDLAMANILSALSSMAGWVPDDGEDSRCASSKAAGLLLVPAGEGCCRCCCRQESIHARRCSLGVPPRPHRLVG